MPNILLPRPLGSGFEFSPFAAGPALAQQMINAIGGSNGTIITNGGTPLTLPAAGLSTAQAFAPSLGVTFVAFSVTNAQMIAGADLTFLLGVAGRIMVPILSALIHLNSTAGAYGGAKTISLRYGNGTTDITSPQNGPQAVAGERWITAAPSTANHGANSPVGQNVKLVFSGASVGGNPANTLTYAFAVMTSAGF